MAKGKYINWITDEGKVKIQGWAQDGLTDEQIAKNIGINVSTLYEWKNKYPEIDESLKKGKEVVDREVENALFKRAIGYKTTDHQFKMVDVDSEVLKTKRRKTANEYKLDHPEATQQEIDDYAVANVPTREKVEVTQNERDVPPDTTAAIFWLKNRKPVEWRDQQHLELNGNVNNPFDKVSTAELKKLGKKFLPDEDN